MTRSRTKSTFSSNSSSAITDQELCSLLLKTCTILGFLCVAGSFIDLRHIRTLTIFVMTL